jgi:hypothetical protein
MVFGSFNLHDEFFAKHRLNSLADVVRVLVQTRQKFNFYRQTMWIVEVPTSRAKS